MVSHQRLIAWTGEAGGIVIGTNADPAFVIAYVVDAIRDGAPQFGVDKIMHIDGFRRSFGMPFTAVVFEIPYEFLLLRINRDNRLIRRHKRLGLIADVLKLCVSVHVTASFPCLTVCLETVPKFAQTVGNYVRTRCMVQTIQLLR